MRLLPALLVSATATIGACVSRSVPPAELVIRGGRIVTADDANPEAQALAARDGKIVFVGSTADAAAYVGPTTRVIDLNGQFAMPGFIEGHGHFTGIGETKLGLQLLETTSWAQIVRMVAEAARNAKPGQWIIGHGWHQDKWTSPPAPNVEGFPMHASLDAVSPNNPVLLTHASGHGAFVNAKAMALSNITRSTPNPMGGEILKDKNGEPIGFLRETAANLARPGAGEPQPSPDERATRDRHVLELADQELISKGITSFQDAGSDYSTIDLYKKAVDDGRMHVRMWMI